MHAFLENRCSCTSHLNSCTLFYSFSFRSRMTQRKLLYVLSLTKDDNERYIWTRVWQTNREKIKKELEEKKISVISDHKTGEPIVTATTTNIDTHLNIVRKCFHQMSGGMKAVKRRSLRMMVDSEVTQLSVDFEKMEVGVYFDQDKDCLWFVGNPVIIENIDSHFKTTYFVSSLPCRSLRQPNDENDSSFENSFEHIPNPIQINLTEDELAIIWLNDLFGCGDLPSELFHVKCDRFDIKISLVVCPEKDVVEKKIRKKLLQVDLP